MINKFASLAVVAVMVMCMVSIALARGAPTKEKAFSDQVVVSTHVAPTVANVPPMTVGFDVIQNLTTAYPRPANANQYAADTSVRGSRSTTVAERNYTAATSLLGTRSGSNFAMVSRS